MTALDVDAGTVAEPADIIDARGVSVAYRTGRGRHLALDGADLRLARGDFVALVGPSGCGKSTLLKVIAGLVERSAGEVSVAGVPVGAPPPHVGMLFQNDALLPWRTVTENVRLPLQVDGTEPRPEQDGRIRELLARVGLEDYGDYLPRQLSGGMRKRVALARGLAIEPELFLMDEPFGPLDALTRRKIGAEFLALWETLRTSVLFVTHDVDEAIVLADRIVVMSAAPGRVTHEFPVDLPRPRDARSLRFTPAFRDLYEAVSDALDLTERHRDRT